MLHRITGRARKCGPSAISAIAGVPTHEAAAVIRRLFDRPAVNGVGQDELGAALAELGWKPDYMLLHPKYPDGRWIEDRAVYDRIFSAVPRDLRALTLRRFLDLAPSGAWAIAAASHWIAYGEGHVADSGYWLSRKPRRWNPGDPGHAAMGRRRVAAAIRFARAS